jgi:LacI family transcriptional regulator
MFDRVIDEIPCDKVIVDDVATSKKAVQQLINSGCKKIGIISTRDYVSVGKLRTRGYIEALKHNDIGVDFNAILKIDDEFQAANEHEALEKQIESFFKINPDLDGIFAVNEIYAITAMKIARKLGKSIPGDIQFIGFTDGVLSQHAYPPLSTVSQHGFEMGEIAAKLLIERLEKQDEEDESYQTVVVNTEIVNRETTL